MQTFIWAVNQINITFENSSDIDRNNDRINLLENSSKISAKLLENLSK